MKDSCNLVIFINHIGFEDDIKLAEEMPANSIDLIIGGHTHTVVNEDIIKNGTRIVQAGRDLKYATLIQLFINPNGNVKSSSKLISIGKQGNEIIIINLTGAEIYDFYKAAYYADEYRILYASGIKSTYIVSNEELKDIKLFTPDNKPLVLDKVYKVAMNSYVLSATKFNHKDKGENKFITTAENMIN